VRLVATRTTRTASTSPLTRTCSTICDLSRFVIESGGVFDTRDDVFERFGSFEDTWKGKAFEWLYAGRSSA